MKISKPNSENFDKMYEHKIKALFKLCEIANIPMNDLWGNSKKFTELKSILEEKDRRAELDLEQKRIYGAMKGFVKNVYFNTRIVEFVKSSYHSQCMGNPICLFCNKSLINEKKEWVGTLDHIAHKKKYKEHTFSITNLVPMCANCNFHKSQYDTVWIYNKEEVINSDFKIVHPYKEDTEDFYYFDTKNPYIAKFKVTKEMVDRETNLERKGELIVNYNKTRNTINMVKVNEPANVIDTITTRWFEKNEKENEKRGSELADIMKDQTF